MASTFNFPTLGEIIKRAIYKLLSQISHMNKLWQYCDSKNKSETFLKINTFLPQNQGKKTQIDLLVNALNPMLF